MKRTGIFAFLLAASALTSQAGNLIISGDVPLESVPGRVAASSMQSASASATFEVLGTDRTIREVLQRWARASGWRHDQVHWTLQRDFPIEGTASAEAFKGDFRAAVRTLLASTEATDLPVQPCFYTNFIVRVVPRAEVCDRNPGDIAQ